jgi:hypothetical protein
VSCCMTAGSVGTGMLYTSLNMTCSMQLSMLSRNLRRLIENLIFQVGDFLFFFFFFRLGTATSTGVSSNASAFRLFVDGVAVSFRTKQDTKNPFVASSPGEQRMRDVASSARRVD